MGHERSVSSPPLLQINNSSGKTPERDETCRVRLSGPNSHATGRIPGCNWVLNICLALLRCFVFLGLGLRGRLETVSANDWTPMSEGRGHSIPSWACSRINWCIPAPLAPLRSALSAIDAGSPINWRGRPNVEGSGATFCLCSYVQATLCRFSSLLWPIEGAGPV